MINIMKFRSLFLFISLSLIITSIYSIVKWGFRTSIDFSGGSIWELTLPTSPDKSKIEAIFANQKISLDSLSANQSTFVLKFKNITSTEKATLDAEIIKLDKDFKELKFETLGPVLGKELLQKTILAIVLASIALLLFIGSKFKDFSFGAGAILAMFHDSFILIGAFSLLGHFFGAQLDTLFVTALLTTLSASVHDTVVTFDRIRELKLHHVKFDWVELANRAVSETIVRSINNSMTIIFMLLSLVILGGPTTRWFATALLIGVVCGTYSSTAVAIPLVLWFKSRRKS